MLTERSRTAIVTCSALAIATALAAGPREARAQSFQGTGTPLVPGSASISVGTATTTVTVNSSQAVIDWALFPAIDTIANNTPVVFQPQNTTATFQNNGSGASFAVLNRINPTDLSRPVQFNGNVVSRLLGFGAPISGGTVYFYSPGGVIVGPSAVFNVGNLGLTSAAPVADSGGNWINGNTVQFQQARPGSRVEIQGPAGSSPGAQITASSNNSYVAAFAPVVTQAGAINVNGSAALVAAEAGTITFSPGGLFDIQVAVGSDGDAGGVGIHHQGTTGGPANNGSGSVHRVYLVAIPKNQLLTMAIERGSSLGFDVAGAANVQGNAVVLSAGYNVSSGSAISTPAGAAPANILIDDSSATLAGSGIDFTSATSGRASGTIDVQVVRETNFASDVSFRSPVLSRITVDRLGTGPAGVLDVAGDLTLSGDTDFQSTGSTSVAGVDAGQARLRAFNGGSANISGNLRLSAQAYVDNDQDGLVRAGFADIQVTGAGSALTVDGDVTLDGSASSFSGGNARGGNVAMTAGNGATIAVEGGLFGYSDANAGPGSVGTGNFVNIIAANGTISLGSVQISADGFAGGESSSGGDGQGGTVVLAANGTGGRLTVLGDASLSADGSGEFGGEGGGGDGRGGMAQITTQGGVVSIEGATELSADGFGGGTFGSAGSSGGAGAGGTAQLFVNAAGTINLADVDLHADGNGGSAFFDGTIAGAGTGGFARALLTSPTGATPGAINVAGDFLAFAQGYGGTGPGLSFFVPGPTPPACPTCLADGGLATGGAASITTAAGKTVTIGGVTEINAGAFGGDSGEQAAGSALGGRAFVFADGGTITFGTELTVDAGAIGGTHFTGGVAGDATGGMATIDTGALGGTIRVMGEALVAGDAIGGESLTAGGIGGNAGGGVARIAAQSGSIAFDGAAVLSARATGGNGAAVGGSATGGGAEVLTFGTTGGSIATGGALSVDATGQGGNGFDAGDGSGGLATIEAEGGTITVASLTSVLAQGLGGTGIDGGSGGNGLGGEATLLADNSASAPVSTVTVGDVFASASGVGGNGGAGLQAGNAGGAGGSGTGGLVEVTGEAGNGMLVATSVLATANGLGGNGGAGVSSDIGSGGAGGAGGSGNGGTVEVGVDSGIATAGSTASSSLGPVAFSATGTGGNGGNAGAGSTGSGTTVVARAGAGGNGTGGLATLLVHGGPLTVTTAAFEADGVGGNGGASGGANSVAGAGGNAASGSAGVSIANRELGTSRGVLTADSVFAHANAQAGSGATAGAGTLAGSVFFDVQNGDATIGQASLTALADLVDPSAPVSLLNVLGGTVDIADDFTFVTSGLTTVQLDDATFNASTMTLAASNWVLPQAAPTLAGTFNISNGLGLFSDLDLVTYANFNVGFDTGYQVAGAFQVGNYTSPGRLFVTAAGPATLGDIDVSALDIISQQDIVTGSITSGDYADLEAVGSIATGAVSAGGYVDFAATAGSIATGDVEAGQTVTLEAGTTVTAGNIVGGDDPENIFSIGLVAGGDIVAGNLTGTNAVGLLSLAGSIDAGDIAAGAPGVLVLADNAVDLGSVTTSPTGTTYIANASMAALGGQLEEFDPAPILAAAPVATGGSITINGPVTTGTFQAASGSTLTVAGAVNAGGLVELSSAGEMLLGDIAAGSDIDLTSGAGLTGGALTSGDSVTAVAPGNISLGALSAGLVNPTSDVDAGYTVGIASTAGSVAVGNVAAARGVGLLAAGGNLSAGSITAGTDALLLAQGAVATGAISVDPVGGRAYIANASLAPLGGAIDDNFDPEPIFAAAPLATGGPITIAGPVTAGSLRAASGGALTIGSPTVGAAVTANGPVELTSTGALLVGDVTTGAEVILASGGTLTAGNVAAGGLADLSSAGALLVGNVGAHSDIELESRSGTVTGGALTSGDSVTALAAGAIALGNLSAGLVNPSSAVDAGYNVGIASNGGAVTVGNVAAARGVGLLAGGGALTAGSIGAGTDVLLLAQGGVSTGGIAAAPTNGRILIGNASLAALGGSLQAFNPAPVLAVTAPAPVGGAIAIGGPVTGSSFTAAATGNLTAGALTLGQRIAITGAATAQVNGAWVAPSIAIASQRLQFGTAQTAGLGASGTTQNLTLRALASGQQAVLGGPASTTPGSGYTLTQADYARIRTRNLAIQIDPQGLPTGTPDLEIRDLTLTGSAGGGQSSVLISTSGGARVVGDLVLAQAGATDQLTVSAGRRLEIVLPDGSIAITGTDGALAGTLTLSSDNLVAGTLNLLQQIMANPQAAGLPAALRAPASPTSNLEGYIRANGVTLLGGANILLQNSGTARDFAGVTVAGGPLIIGRVTSTGSGSTGGGTGGTSTPGFSFVGMLMTPSEVLLFDFSTTSASTVTLRTYSYAGGTNAAGTAIPAGGFDPILSLYNAAGMRIGQNDDGGSSVPADAITGARYDTFLSQVLQPGAYKVAVSVFPNFAPDPLSGTFPGATSFTDVTGAVRNGNFAFDVLGATSATGPGSQGPAGPLNLVGFGRRAGVGGSQSLTNNDFFADVNFGNSGTGGLTYTPGSQFNTCLISSGCGAQIPEIDPIASLSSEIFLISQDTLEEEPFEDTFEADSERVAGSDAEEEEAKKAAEAAAEEARSPIAPPAPLIDTRPLNPAVDVVEPVSGSGNPALIGSAVNETATQETQP